MQQEGNMHMQIAADILSLSFVLTHAQRPRKTSMWAHAEGCPICSCIHVLAKRVSACLSIYLQTKTQMHLHESALAKEFAERHAGETK